MREKVKKWKKNSEICSKNIPFARFYYSICEVIYVVKISVYSKSIPFASIPYAGFYCTVYEYMSLYTAASGIQLIRERRLYFCCLTTKIRIMGGFSIEMETQLSKLITYSLAIVII